MEKYIIFSSNHQTFALDISKIERIIEFQSPNPIPEASGYLLGVIQYNDRILPIIDLTKRLYNIDSYHNVNNKVIVVLWKDQQIGLVVDDIMGINAIDEDQFELSNEDTQISKEYITGFIKTKENITIVLDTDKLFSKDQEAELLTSTNIEAEEILEASQVD